jgi:hypothetical protein
LANQVVEEDKIGCLAHKVLGELGERVVRVA